MATATPAHFSASIGPGNQATNDAPHASLPNREAGVPSFEGEDANVPVDFDHSHPCYPHPNPHVPLSSPLYGRTRIIRIPRDWTIAGDLAPTYSYIYPEILEPWVTEVQFRQLVTGINERSIATFSPLDRPGQMRKALDLILGLATGWIWEDAGLTASKKGAADIEAWIEEWNGRVRKEALMGLSGGAIGKDEAQEIDLVKAIPLRRTAYLSVDIQVPDPKLGIEEGEDEEAAQTKSRQPDTKEEISGSV